MDFNVEPVGGAPYESTALRRAEIEGALTLAIKRAEKQYRQVTHPAQEPRSTPNPSHLGIRVDVRA